ncbi:hypothetical protein ACIRTB_11525 [Streptomyces sp. NPDC101158]|uniref:hypothetical protein n=1 Tax=Streptomyces sp. NPDC101158 TaxID=3366117 RepID=UPI00380017AC
MPALLRIRCALPLLTPRASPGTALLAVGTASGRTSAHAEATRELDGLAAARNVVRAAAPGPVAS